MVAEIKLRELRAKMERGEEFALVEALPPWNYRKQHLPGAINVPFNRVDRYAESRLPDKDQEIIVYCGKFT
jgi:rhodanese-related sulfurtransferase